MTKNKKFKRVFSKAFVVGIAALAAGHINVNALNIRETAGVTYGTDDSETNTVIGITRLTGAVATQASVTASNNDMLFHFGEVGYEGSKAYVFDFGAWYELPEEIGARPTKVTDSAILASLNTRDIYYIDNVEKEDVIIFNRTAPEGYTFEFVADKANKSKNIRWEDGKLYIPATVEKVTVYTAVNGRRSDVFDTLVKTSKNVNTGEYSYISTTAATGLIAADGKITTEQNGRVSEDGQTITIFGEIAWINSGDVVGASSSEAGYRVGVKLSTPSGTAIGNLNEATVIVNPGEEGKEVKYKWTAEYTDANYAFLLTPIVEIGKTYTIKVVWADESEQTFKIVVDPSCTYEAKPVGTIAGTSQYFEDEEGNKTDLKLSATASGDTLTFGGNGQYVAWPADGEGNVEVLITPNAKYTNDSSFRLSSLLSGNKVTATVKVRNPRYNANDPYSTETQWIDDSVELYLDTKTVNGVEVLAVSFNFEEVTANKLGRDVTLSVKWPDGFEQVFKVVLDSNTRFEFPDVVADNLVTIMAYGENSNTEGTYTFDDETNEATINGTVVWDENRGGHYATVSLDASAFNGNYDLLSVRVDNTIRTSGGAVVKFNNSGKYTFDLAIEKRTNPYVIEVLWNNSVVVETYKVYVTSNGLQSVGTTAFTSINSDYLLPSANGKLVVTKKDSTAAPIPYAYDVNGNAVRVKLSNSSYASGKAAVVTISGNGFNYVVNPANNKSTEFNVRVQLGRDTTVKVDWGNGHVETFTITPDANLRTADFASAGLGSFTVNGQQKTVTGEGNVTSQEDYDAGETIVLDTTTNKVAWAASNAKMYDNDLAGYRVNFKITAPTGLAVSQNPYFTINTTGSDTYTSSTKVYFGNSRTKVVYANGDITNLPALSLFNGTTLEIDPIVTAATNKVTVTVWWTDVYKETFVVDLSRAAFADQTVSSTMTAGKYENRTGTIDYRDVIDYDSSMKMYVLNAVLNVTNTSSDSLESVTITDAYDTRTRTSTSFNLNFTNEKRTAEIDVKYTNGYVEHYVIDATNAKMPDFYLVNLDKDNKGEFKLTSGKYSMTVKKDQEIVFTNGVTVNDGYAIKYTVDGTVVKENNLGKLIASAYGTYTVRAQITDGTAANDSKYKYVDVTVTVVGDPIVATPSYEVIDALSKTAKVTVVVEGGANEDYVVTATKAYALNKQTGKYDTSVAADLTEFSRVGNTNEYYAVLNNYDGTASYYFEINVRDNNALMTKVSELRIRNVQYTVKFDADGGSGTYAAQTVNASGKVVRPSVDPKKEFNDNGIMKGYKFLGWFTEDKFDEDGKLISEYDETDAYDFTKEVGSNMTLKAAWATTPYSYAAVLDGATWNASKQAYVLSTNVYYDDGTAGHGEGFFADLTFKTNLTNVAKNFEGVTVNTVRPDGASRTDKWLEISNKADGYNQLDTQFTYSVRFAASSSSAYISGQEAIVTITWANGYTQKYIITPGSIVS